MSERVDRTILKLSGELFRKEDENISFERYDIVARQIKHIIEETKVQMAIVVGGGNIFRGRLATSNVDHTEADAMGMLATVINGIGLRDALVRNGAKDTRLMTAFDIHAIAEPYIRLKANHHLDEHRLVIISGGLEIPNFSTDSAVAQYADEIHCGIIFKASTVDGVYDSDPRYNPNAIRYTDITYNRSQENPDLIGDELSSDMSSSFGGNPAYSVRGGRHREAISQDLGIMNKTAFAMCMKSGIPIFVFNIKDLDRLPQILDGDRSFGTLIHK